MTKNHRKRTNNGHRDLARRHDLRRRMKDRDQIQDDMEKGITFEHDHELPGGGQHYCVTCARHFISADAFGKHQASKAHKRRLVLVTGERYTQEDADLAGEMTREPQSRFERERLAAKQQEMTVEAPAAAVAPSAEVVMEAAPVVAAPAAAADWDAMNI